jgi:hypothetical protein
MRGRKNHLRFGGSGDALSNRAFLMLLGSGFLMYYVFTQDWQALPIYSKNFLGMPDFLIGLFLAGNGLLIILLQLPIAHMIDERSKSGALSVGSGFVRPLVGDAPFDRLVVGGVRGVRRVLHAGGDGSRSRGGGVCFGDGPGETPGDVPRAVRGMLRVAGSLLEAGLPSIIWAIQIVAASLAAALLVFMRLARKP